MRNLQYLAYRYITQAEFYNLYKPEDSEDTGGGQTYIDFPTRSVTPQQWTEFFNGAEDLALAQATNGPSWTVRVRSIGLPEDAPRQSMKVYQRRPASIIVSSQYLYSREQNRVLAWHPDFGFPEPADNRERQQRPPGLVVFLARTDNGEVWAGWFLNDSSESWPVADSDARDALMPMLSRSNLGSDGAAGFIDLSRAGVQIDELNYVAPFRASQGLPGRIAPSVGQGTEFVPSSDPLEASERAFAEAYLDQDEVPAVTDEERVYYSRVRRRNQRAARALKSLYSEECQITGDAYTFEKRDGTRYVEVHHLVPLGEGGADDPRNMIVTSALTHRQLHYANVEGVDLSRISTRPDGWGELPVTINGEPALIVWHPLHAQLIEANEEPDGV